MRTRNNVVIAGRGGFTLVELLVSVALTVFMLTLFATLFSAGNDAVRVARGTGEIERSLQGAIMKLRRDLQFVYIGDNVSLGKAFSAADQIPSAGYFTIEENMPASPPYYLSDEDAASKLADPLKSFVQAIQNRIVQAPVGYTGKPKPTTMYRQGIDERGLPVEVDVDDVLAFTVKLTGNSPENIMYGKVPIGSILDSDLDPGSRFDQPDNGIFTSPYAEVAYFLRPNRPYTVAEISRPALGSDDGKIPTPATYTLYRRELLLLSPQQRNQVEKRIDAESGNATVSALYDMSRIAANATYLSSNPSLNSSNTASYNPSFYHNYDVSARFAYDLRKDTTKTGDSVITNYSLRFNDPISVRLRQNRYGMQWFTVGGAVPLPIVYPDLAVPAYDYPAALGAKIYVPGSDINWHGRPTLYESTMVGAEGLSDVNYNPTVGAGLFSALGLTNNSSPFYTTTLRQQSSRRNDADVLLTNVLSFDVKVLNDDVVQGLFTPTPGGSVVDVDPTTSQPMGVLDPFNWPGARTSALLSLDQTYDAVNYKVVNTINVFRPGVITGNSSRPWTDPVLGVPASLGIVQQDFLDIGNLLTTEYTSNLASNSPRSFWDSSIVPTSSAFIIAPAAGLLSVPWGTQTPARWASTGRREASYAYYFPTTDQPLRSVYDTWAPEYRPELFANNFVTPVIGNGFLPPYDRPVRGVQITIRIWEPRTGLTREFQIVHRFK